MTTPGRAILLLTIATSAFAATTVTQTVDPQQLGTEDIAQVMVEVTNAQGGATVDLPATDDFEILGRSSSTSTSVQMGLGAGPSVTRAQRFSFSIRANHAGTIQIPAAAITVDGQKLSGDPIQLEVTPGHVAQARPQRQDPFASMFGGADPFSDDPFFEDFFNRRRNPMPLDAKLVASVDKPRVYQGEQATVSFYLATRSPLTSVGGFKLPTIDGASARDIDVGKKPAPHPMTLDGKEYQAFLVARRALFPSRAGTLKIPEASVEVHGRTITSRVSTIEVAPIPPGGEPGEPIGTWCISARANGRAQVGQPLPIEVEVSGTGDLQAIPEPALELEGARVLSPSVKDTGADKRTWEFLVMPEKAGPLVIPPVRMAFFNPATERHEKALTEPLTLDVAAAPTAAPPPVATKPAEKTPKTDFAPIATAAGSIAVLALLGFVVPPLVRKWNARRAQRPPSHAAFRRHASSALAKARVEAKADRGHEAIRLAEQALFDAVRSAGLQPEKLDPDALAQDPTRPFLSGWAQALLECRQARFLRLDPAKVDSILARVAHTLSIPPSAGVPATFAQ